MYINTDAIPDTTKRITDDISELAKIIEYTNNGNGTNSKNKTAKELPIAILGFCRYNGIINLFNAFHNVEESLAQIASTRCRPSTIRILKPDSFTFFPSAPSSIISPLTPSCVPIASYVVLLIIKKLPKKYPVFFVGSFTRNAENLVCKNIEIMGRVILVIGSKHNIGFIFASTDITLGNSFAYFLIISPVESSDESLMAIIS